MNRSLAIVLIVIGFMTAPLGAMCVCWAWFLWRLRWRISLHG